MIRFSGPRVLRFSGSQVLGFVLAVLPIAVLAQQRDAGVPAAVPGTGQISGVVVSAESSPQPMRRVVVTLTGGVPTPRSVVTDDEGRFAFAQLPVGTFTVTARKAAYIAAPYGAKAPGRTGMPIVLAAGQRADIAITIFRGAAVSGTLRDSSGLPVAGVDVRAIDARTLLMPPDQTPPEISTSDDRGVFRIFGLLPGDYYVAALPLPGGQGAITAPTTASIDSALSALAARQNTAGSAPPIAPPVQSPRTIGFAPVFYPGTPNHAEAVRVRVEAGDERAGVNFELMPVTMASIEGTVSGDLANMSQVQVTIIPSGPRVETVMSSNSLSGKPLDGEGKFSYTNLPPGNYRLVARARRGGAPASTAPTLVNGVNIGGGGSGSNTPVAGQPPATGDYLYGAADVELRGQDAVSVNLVLQPGGTMTGRILFGSTGTTAKPEDLSKLRPMLSYEGGGGMVSSGGLTMGAGLIASPISSVKADGTFEIRGIGPGRFNFNMVFPTPAEGAGWKLRSAAGTERDLLDGPTEMGPGIDMREVVVRFSDARTEVSGTLQTGSGQTTTEYYIVALPADRALWRPKSRRILSTRPATDGRFVFGDLPAGEYVIAALSDLDPLDLLDTSFLEQIAPSGVKVNVVEGQKAVQDLRIR